MALITCKDCKKEFSTDANRCPHCGARKPLSKPLLGCATVVIALTAVSIFAVALDPSPPASLPATPASFSQQMKRNDQCKTTPVQDNAVKALIQLHGYDCRTVDVACRYAFSEGFTVYCNDGRYTFEIENHGGNWSVKSR